MKNKITTPTTFDILGDKLQSIFDDVKRDRGTSSNEKDCILINPQMMKEVWLYSDDDVLEIDKRNMQTIKLFIRDDLEKLNLPLVKFAIWIHKKFKKII